MERTKKDKLYVLKFILFSIVFIGTVFALCSLWKYVRQHTIASSGASTSQGFTVIIDAGHGGRDGGATALSAIPEKDLNLDIALALRDYLTAAGIDVIMTRTEDIMLSDGKGGTNKSQDLRARQKIAESTENAVFVSIHMNSFPIEKYSGLQVYYSDNSEKSAALASSIQERSNATLCSGSNRKIKNAGDSIYLLSELQCPAILVECGFLSNSEEAERLNDPEYRKALAFLIAVSIADSLNQESSASTAANPNGLT